MVHALNGMFLIPLLALLLLIVSFFAKVPRGITLAFVVLLFVVLQVTLGIFGHMTPYAGLLHGINAFLVVGSALGAGSPRGAGGLRSRLPTGSARRV